jgi:hypothetical protein
VKKSLDWLFSQLWVGILQVVEGGSSDEGWLFRVILMLLEQFLELHFDEVHHVELLEHI